MRGGGLFGHFSIFSFTNGLVKKQKGESHNGRKQRTSSLLKNPINTDAYQEVRNVRFSNNLAWFVSLLLVTPALRFTLFLYYRKMSVST